MNRYIAYLKDWRTNLNLVFWLGAYTKPYASRMVILLIVNSLAALVSVAVSLLIKSIIDSATSNGDITQSVSLYLGVAVASLAFNAVINIFSTMINENFSYSIRREIYGSVMRTRIPALSGMHSGDMLTRMTSDVNTVAGGITEIIPSILSLTVSFLAAFITMAYFNWRLALFPLILGPIAGLISVITGRRVKKYQVKVQESESAYRSSMQETLENLVVIKSFEEEAHAELQLDALQGNRIFWIKKRLKVGTISRVALGGIFQLSFVGVFAYSAMQLSAGIITVGMMMMFTSLVGQIQAPISDLALKIPKIISVLASATRIREMERLPKEEKAALDLPGKDLGVALQQLSFSYGNELILKNANLQIASGQFVALMGSSGIGKTTLIRLMMAFYLPQAGQIELLSADGRRGEVTAGARNYISYVPQGNTLMSGTIADNLRVGRRDATEDEMWRILKVVAAEQFVLDTPQGLQTVIGERGLGLSEGQAQRLAIARALIKNAPILILDEATSALDEETELAVLRHLRQAKSRPTCILITHRRSVLEFCDRCVRIHNKEIQEELMSDSSSMI